ncbi:MAG: hypothetical protein H6686_01805 [Fibrobacteria bacterium]|nr:hypothetical protein [Fibrobacteria bacterium]
MSNIMVYWFSKGQDEVGFADRALNHLVQKGLAVRDGEEEFALLGKFGEFNGECGNVAIREKLPAALPEEAQNCGLCPKCSEDLGVAFLDLHESLVAPSAFEPGSEPMRNGETIQCSSCGWTGRFDEVESGIQGEAFLLRREYLALYDVYVDEVEPLHELASEVPGSAIMVVSTT